MAEVNTPPLKKRKLSENEDVIEIVDDDVPSENSQDCVEVEIVETDSKILSIDTSQSSEFNLDIVSLNSPNSNEIIKNDRLVEFKQRLLELEDTIKQLKAENEELKSRTCASPITRSDSEKAAIIINFNNEENFDKYTTNNVLDSFRSGIQYTMVEDKKLLRINIYTDNDINPDEWVVIDNDITIEGKHQRKKKKKRIRKRVTPELYILDTTPSLSTKNDLKYESKFTVINDTNDKTGVNEVTCKSLCFNCNENHNLRDCTKPKDSSKINIARQKFKSQSKLTRYHLEDEQRFAHLHPGKLSETLKKALGLKRNQLPQHIYRMRILGYPPGWLNEILAIQHSNLVLFDFKGKDAFNKKKTVQDLDPDKIVEFPGFNAPIERGIKDEYRLYGCPAYSKQLSKQRMLEDIRQTQKKAEDNLKICDMEIDTATSDKEVEVINCSNQDTFLEQPNISPSLNELESEKQKLLEELVKNVDESQAVKDMTPLTNKVSEASIIIDKTITEDKKEENVNISVTNVVKTSCFGTPILKSASPYSHLPNSEKFSKDVSEVINFENLPNTTGKYEQMMVVLDKVRKTLKFLNDSKL